MGRKGSSIPIGVTEATSTYWATRVCPWRGERRSLGLRNGWDVASFDHAFALHTYEDSTGEASRILRKMGDLHQLGFEHFNNSSIKTAFFDDVVEPSHLDRASRRAVERTLRALGSMRERIDSNPELMASRPEDAAELRWSVMASIAAVEKTLAAKRFLAWRKRPGSLSSSGRRRLAATLEASARSQTQLRRQLRALWLKRNAPSNFEIVSRLFSRSIRSLKRAARMLSG